MVIVIGPTILVGSHAMRRRDGVGVCTRLAGTALVAPPLLLGAVASPTTAGANASVMTPAAPAGPPQQSLSSATASFP
jgi:hypothetical protein